MKVHLIGGGSIDYILNSMEPGDEGQKTATETIPAPPGKKNAKIFGINFLIDDCYELTKLVGRGSYGVVASGVNKKTNQPVAIKKVTDIFANLGDTKRVLREITILKFLKHKNIISLIDIMSIDDPKGFTELYLVFELMASNLSSVISQIELNDLQIKTLIYQLLLGIHYMHSADIIHRDIKPENLLVSRKCELKIGDLNLARKCENEDDSRTYYVVTRWYRAPEVLLFSSSYTKPIDVWSVGCILAEMIGRTILFKGTDYMDQFMRIVAIMGHPSPQDFEGDATVLENLSTLLKPISSFSREKVKWQNLFKNANALSLDLLDNMLVYNPKKRFTIEQCLNHPYLKDQLALNPPFRCNDEIDWSFDNLEATEEVLRQKILEEVQSFHRGLQDLPTFKRETPSTTSECDSETRKIRKLADSQT